MLQDDFELDTPKWTKENFAEKASEANIDVAYWGAPEEALFSDFGAKHSRDAAFEVEDDWVTVGLVQTESMDTFLFHAPGRLSRRDLAAEVFLSDPEYYKSPGELGFLEVNYFKLNK